MDNLAAVDDAAYKKEQSGDVKTPASSPRSSAHTEEWSGGNIVLLGVVVPVDKRSVLLILGESLPAVKVADNLNDRHDFKSYKIRRGRSVPGSDR